MTASPGGALLTGFSTAYTKQKDYQRQKAQLEADQQAQSDALRNGGYNGEYAAPNGSYGTAGPAISTDPVSPNLDPNQMAFLNAVAGGESNGAYDARYTPNGAATFDLNGQHPQIYEPTRDGRKSSAAGRYQFVYSTWHGLAGDAPFSEVNQDDYAWKLADQDYRAHTGRDLASDLKTHGLTADILNTLTPTWSSFGTDQAQRIKDYNDSLARYAPAAPAVGTLTDAARSILPLNLGS